MIREPLEATFKFSRRETVGTYALVLALVAAIFFLGMLGMKAIDAWYAWHLW